MLQVSFFRSNLVLRVVKKPTGRTPDGQPAVLDALVNYVECVKYLLFYHHPSADRCTCLSCGFSQELFVEPLSMRQHWVLTE